MQWSENAVTKYSQDQQRAVAQLAERGTRDPKTEKVVGSNPQVVSEAFPRLLFSRALKIPEWVRGYPSGLDIVLRLCGCLDASRL